MIRVDFPREVAMLRPRFAVLLVFVLLSITFAQQPGRLPRLALPDAPTVAVSYTHLTLPTILRV